MDGWNVSILLIVSTDTSSYAAVPAGVIDEMSRTEAFDTAVDFIKTAYLNHGWAF